MFFHLVQAPGKKNSSDEILLKPTREKPWTTSTSHHPTNPGFCSFPCKYQQNMASIPWFHFVVRMDFATVHSTSASSRLASVRLTLHVTRPKGYNWLHEWLGQGQKKSQRVIYPMVLVGRNTPILLNQGLIHWVNITAFKKPGFETGSQPPIPGVSNASGSGLSLKAPARCGNLGNRAACESKNTIRMVNRKGDPQRYLHGVMLTPDSKTVSLVRQEIERERRANSSKLRSRFRPWMLLFFFFFFLLFCFSGKPS